jgi:glycosyltransferase involved in cell wall biosynthesis
MYKIVHLIPHDDIGGVEIAAASMREGLHGRFDYRRKFVFTGLDAGAGRGLRFSPLPILSAIKKYAGNDVDILVVSLWRALLVGLMVKLLRPELKLVVFIHNSRDAHFVDYAVTRIAVSLADRVWSDSEASWQQRLAPTLQPPPRTISFVTRRIEPLPDPSLAPEFIFWGRMSRQKDLPRALRIFAGVCRNREDARYHIIGPDGGQLATIKSLCNKLGVSEKIRFYGPLAFARIRDTAASTCFYLQTSLYEGMAMSVVEAMQMGLVPVVTPVGEIRHYCAHGENAILIRDDEQAVNDIVRVLDDENDYPALRKAAIGRWNNARLYSESFIDAANELVGALSST